jgi:TonB family protein
MMNQAWKQWEGSVVDGRFALRELQGSSDHSVVFLTNHGPQAQTAAIKLVEANPISAQLQLSRWERAAQLSHRHLIRILRWGRCQLGNLPMLYVVTEFADENLSQILPNRPLTASETEYMLRSVLEVLAYLHGAGLAHARLKPANLMAVGDDLKLSSDTICAAGEKGGSTREPTVYDAPEMATTGPSPAGDIWSLGTTLVEALTQRPSPGEAIRQGDPAVPETLPPPFLEIARQCVRLDPERRWTVPEIAARLLPPPAPPQERKLSRYVVAALVVVALGGLLAGPKLLHRSPPETPVQSVQGKDPVPPVPDQPTTKVADNSGDNRAQKSVEAPKTSPPSSMVTPVPSRPTPKKPGGSSAAGAVAGKVLPSVSQKSRNTITGKVRVGVRLAVDPSGRVVRATLAAPGPSRYFANVALDAARRWTFMPPRVAGEAVASEWMVRFAFGKQGVDANPEQVSP